MVGFPRTMPGQKRGTRYRTRVQVLASPLQKPGPPLIKMNPISSEDDPLPWVNQAAERLAEEEGGDVKNSRVKELRVEELKSSGVIEIIHKPLYHL